MPTVCVNPDLQLILEAIVAGSGPILTNYALETGGNLASIDASLIGTDTGLTQADLTEEILVQVQDINTNTAESGGKTIAKWLDDGFPYVTGTFTYTQGINNTNTGIARGFAQFGGTTQAAVGFASSGSADLQDEIDEALLQLNTHLASLGSSKYYNSVNINITNYLVGAVVTFQAVASLIVSE